MKKEIKAVVLAAGMSTRMKSDYSKLVHKILGKEIINFLLDSLVEAGIVEENIILIAGKNIDQLKKAVSRNVCYAIQEQQLGTGDALLSASEHIRDFNGDVMVLAGDNPYITALELKKLIQCHNESDSRCTFISAVFPGRPPAYGRIIRDADEEVTGVVEEADASPEQIKIREVNSSIYLFDNEVVFPLLAKIDNNNEKGEYYLTDIIKILHHLDHRMVAVKTDDYFISIGINNRWELQEAQKKFNDSRLKDLAVNHGVTILQPESVTIECDVKIGRDTVIYPSTYIASGTTIGENCQIGPFVFLENITIEDNKIIRPAAAQN
ncbi:MAG: NTP transferase domain-containing protein [bacterium]|nr:NTP transferase domain-containing protein [bacterium]